MAWPKFRDGRAFLVVRPQEEAIGLPRSHGQAREVFWLLTRAVSSLGGLDPSRPVTTSCQAA